MSLPYFDMPKSVSHWSTTTWFHKPDWVKDIIAADIFEQYLIYYEATIEDAEFYMKFDLQRLEKAEEFEKCAMLKYTIEEYIE